MDEKRTAPARIRFFVEQEAWTTQAAIIFMALSAVFRLIGSIGRWGDSTYTATQIVLPLTCNLLFILFLVLFGRRAIWTTALPVLGGVVFFIIKSLGFESWWHTLLCIGLYLLVAIVYLGTVTGVIRTKWLLPPLFALPFVYHILAEDLPALRNTEDPVSFSAGMLEISVLCIMLALLFTGLALKVKKKAIEGDLPRIRDPKVIPPARLREKSRTEPEEGQKPAESADKAAIESEPGAPESETTETEE